MLLSRRALDPFLEAHCAGAFGCSRALYWRHLDNHLESVLRVYLLTTMRTMSSLFQEFRLKDVTLRNRIAVAPMCQYIV